MMKKWITLLTFIIRFLNLTFAYLLSSGLAVVVGALVVVGAFVVVMVVGLMVVGG